jgi:hypothetical protein
MTSHLQVETPSDMVQLKRSNVPSLVCAFSASCTTGGTIYAFGIYGDALKKSLGLSQLQLNAISATFFIAGLFSWLPGMVVDKRGTKFSLVLGGLSGATSVMIYWAVARQFLVIPFVVHFLALLAVCICMSCALIIGSIFKLTLICGGKGTRGSAVGIAKGFVGLGAGVYASIFQSLRTSDESALDFLPVIAFFFLLCATMPAALLLPTKEQAAISIIYYETTPLHFRVMYISLIALGTVIVSSSIGELLNAHHEEVPETRSYGTVLLILVLWLGPITSLLYLPRHHEEDLPTTSTTSIPEKVPETDVTNGEPVKDETTPLVTSTTTSQTESNAPHEVHDKNLIQMLQTPSAWLMLFISTILIGGGTYKTNNMGEMVDSLDFPIAVTPATLALFSVAQMSARVVTGVVSEVTLKWKTGACCIDHGVPRTFYFVVASSIALVSHLLLAYSTDQVSFVILCTLSGLAFGMTWPLMVLVVGDVFGVGNHGANYMFFDGFTKAVGTLFLSEYVAGNVYENHVDPDDPLSCYGPACFRPTHLVVAGLSFLCIFVSLALQYMSRYAYN